MLNAFKNVSLPIIITLFFSACSGGGSETPVSIEGSDSTGGSSSDTVAPSAPGNLRIVGVVQSNSVSIAWDFSTDNVGVSGYQIFRNDKIITPSEVTKTSYTDDAVSANTFYNYRVVAFDAAQNSSSSSPLTVNTPAETPLVDVEPPSAPTNLRLVRDPSTTSVSLEWDASTDNVGVSGYRIFRDNGVLNSVTGTSYTDSVSASQTYEYIIEAFDLAQNTASSEPLSVSTPAVQLPPGNSPSFFVSLNGSDNNSGTQSEPWRTIDASINKLQPGDILNIVDGIYIENIKPKVSGTAQAPIFIRAITPFNVTIDGGGTGRALNIRDVSYLTFEGFKLRNSGEGASLSVNGSDRNDIWPWPVDDLDNLPDFDTHHITLRKMAVRGSCLNVNCNGMLIARSSDILLEDAWIYGAGRYTMSVYGSRRVTVRRVVIRWDQWIGASKPKDPRNELGIYDTFDSTFENIIMIDSGERPANVGGSKGTLLVAGGNNGGTSAYVNSRNNRFFGLVLYNNRDKGIELSSKSGAHDNNYFENSVVFFDTQNSEVYNGKNRTLILNGTGVNNTTFNHMTLLGSQGEGYANFVREAIPSVGNVMKNSLVADSAKIAFRGRVERSYNILFNNAEGQSAGENSSEIDPQLVYALQNNTNPLTENLGDDQKPRGANIFYRYYNGIESTQKLWPWFYQDKIKQDFCDQAYLTEIGRTGDNSSPWCDSNKPLTDYLWEGLTSATCPEDVCNVEPEPLP